MKDKFSIGDRVAAMLDEDDEFCTELVFNEYEDPAYGEIISLPAPGKAMVKWDVDWTENPCEVDTDCIMLEAKAKKAYVRLEKDFFAVQDEIADELKKAAKILKKANKLAQKKTGHYLADLYDAIDPLYTAMDECGWRTSSFNC